MIGLVHEAEGSSQATKIALRGTAKALNPAVISLSDHGTWARAGSALCKTNRIPSVKRRLTWVAEVSPF